MMGNYTANDPVSSTKKRQRKKRERAGKGTYLLKELKGHQLVAIYRLYSDHELNNLKITKPNIMGQSRKSEHSMFDYTMELL